MHPIITTNSNKETNFAFLQREIDSNKIMFDCLLNSNFLWRLVITGTALRATTVLLIYSNLNDLSMVLFFQCDEVYLETQIQNITQSPICLEKVCLDPSQMYTVTPLNSSNENER